jgi:transcription elongation factor
MRLQTAGLKPTLPLIKDLVTTAGGTVELHSISKRLTVEPGAKTYLISCKEDRATWKAYEEKGVPIV